MMQQIFDRKYNDLIVIEDQKEHNGQTLFQSFLIKCVVENTDRKIHLFCLQSPPSTYTSKINSNIIIHDFFKDPRNWLNTASGPINNKFSFECLFGENSSISELKRNIIFIDSLSKLIALITPRCAYKELNFIQKHCFKVITLLHSDELHPPEVIQCLKYSLGAWITLRQAEGPQTGNAETFYASTLVKKVGGKVKTFKEILSVDLHFNITAKELTSEMTKMPAITSNDEQMETLTTFKLGLKSDEKEARSKLVLPYLKNNDGLSNPADEAKIIYIPDSADDFDEEDPDDDLDV